MLNFLLLNSGAAVESTGSGGIVATLSQLVPILLMVAVFYFLLIRPQKKRDKKIQEMRSKIEIGDEIVTSGGILGRVVSIHEDSLVIETSSNNSKVRIAKWAVQANNTPKE